ncbi:hypothetical protein BC829DRAFT_445321 [Chytridium lagenaria]|nr:hypothetical protein BC829DRAFT_445321 [Chytridium lagenaria]
MNSNGPPPLNPQPEVNLLQPSTRVEAPLSQPAEPHSCNLPLSEHPCLLPVLLAFPLQTVLFRHSVKATYPFHRPAGPSTQMFDQPLQYVNGGYGGFGGEDKNYDRYRGSGDGNAGLTKLVKLEIVVSRLQDKGIFHKDKHAVTKKIEELEQSFLKASDWINNTGKGLCYKMDCFQRMNPPLLLRTS